MARTLPIGLDTGTTTVRMIQLGGAPRDVRAVEAAKLVLASEVRADAKARGRAAVEGIRHLLRDHHFRGREVAMALGPEDVAVRHIRMPKTPDEELPTAVAWEVQNKFPFDTAGAVTQYLKAGPVRQGAETLDEIIVFAAPRETVDRRIELATEAGLDLVSLDVEPCAVFRSFERYLRRREDEDTVTGIVDIGAGTTVVIARGREIVFVKTIPVGGAMFNRAVAESLELVSTEAEALRRRLARRGPTVDPADPISRAVSDAIRPPIEDLASEINLCLRYYGVTFHGPGPRTVLLTGGEAHHPTVVAMLGERLEADVDTGDPLRGIRSDQVGPVLNRRGCVGEWATAVGLGLKGFALAEAPAKPCAA